MYHFIVNIHGGSGKAFLQWNKIRELLKEKNIEYITHVPLRVGHAEQIARDISKLDENDIKIIVVGGDGTINEVLNGIGDFSKVKLGLIPTGSGNDFSRGLNLPRHNYKKALDLILNSKADKKIDLGKAEIIESGLSEEKIVHKSRIFGISSGFGLDAIVGTEINTSKIKKVLNWLKMGKLSYAFLTVYTLFKMRTQTVSLKFDDEEEQTHSKMIFMAIMNFKAEGGGVPMAPFASGFDGELSFCMASGIPKILTFFAFPFLLLGKQKIFKSFTLRNFKTLEVTSQSATICHTDGELMGNVAKIKYAVLPSKLTVLV